MKRALPADRTRETLVRREGRTDPRYGVSPEGRPLDQHILLGCMNLDKPPGPTSHEVVALVAASGRRLR